MKLSFVLPAFLCLALPLWGQAPPDEVGSRAGPPKLPDGPMLRPAEEYSQWEITFAYPEDKQKKDKGPDTSLAARPRKMVVTKTGRIVHEEQIDVGNTISELWFDGSKGYVKLGSNPTWLDLKGSRLVVPASLVQLPPSGFQNVEFIKESNYAGTIPYDKGNYLIFTPGGYEKLDLRDPAQQKRMETLNTIGYVDDETRHPVAVRISGVLRTFHFDPAPTEMQTFPPDLADQLKKGEEGNARFGKPAPRPY